MIYECHGHIILDGISYSGAIARHKTGADESFVRHNLRNCAECGIGFYRDGGDRHMVSAFAKQIAGEYNIDYRTPICIIHKKGHYGSMFGRAFETMCEYSALVGEAKRQGADFIKIAASGMLDFAGSGHITGHPLTPFELREMVKIANGEGFAVMVHANGADNIKNALDAGAASIEHGFFIDDGAIRMLAQSGAVWVPTCAAVSNIIGTGRYDDGVLNRILSRHENAIEKAASTGALIASGSDAGAAGVFHGKGALDEYEILHSLKIDPEAGNHKIAELFKPL